MITEAEGPTKQFEVLCGHQLNAYALFIIFLGRGLVTLLFCLFLQNSSAEIQADAEGNSEHEKLAKIEPTIAEAEALAKGLQVSFSLNVYA